MINNINEIWIQQKMKLKELNWPQLKKLRKVQWLKQNKMCCILKKEIPYDKAVFDHLHKKKGEKIGEDGKGLLRGVLHSQANVFEGKILRLYIRYGLHKLISLPELLRNTADYIEHPPMEPEYIHPSERVFEKLKKSEYNKVRKDYFKMYPKKKSFPEYPKSKKLTKKIKNIISDLEEKHDKR